jgi:hypothetical protein
VLETGDKTFRVLIGDNEEVVSVDRLKPHLGAGPVSPAAPPARGRPPVQKRTSTTLAPVTP